MTGFFSFFYPAGRPSVKTFFALTSSLLFLLNSVLATESFCRIHPTQKPYVIERVTYFPIPTSKGYVEEGIASWYGPDFHGRPTSNGERYDMFHMTAAHKTLPMNTVLLVQNIDNKREVVVRINDRGPFVRGRVIDLSYKAAKQLDMVGKGTARVRIVAMARETALAQNGKGPGLPDLRHGEFYIQIGSFSRRQNAINLQKRFTNAGHTTIIQKYFGPGKTFYRVQLYAGKELDKARRAEKALLRHGYTGAFVVAR
ncbi:septal ring lytic transglycosylase RlpA family protein [Desulfopila sp. IMCC35008]|uniref:septal ring lytic transglycosylase RlpA family protein n=1 Tax=Desulfopila sp. IMCC35008 TaxID=2653858 RepID=UPI0013D48754|nr:septal ring lytic transglycosylase RlpA family protein [Desulfopila sp. IMCC35008]